MVRTVSPRVLDFIGDLDKATGRVRISREARQFIEDVWRRTGGNTDAVAAAAAGGDGKTVGRGADFVWRTNPAGVFPTTGLIIDLVATFETSGNQVATRTIRGVLDSSLGTITVSSIASTGAPTTFTVAGQGTDSIRVDISYVVEGQTYANAVITFAAVDLSVAGGTPASGGSK